MDTIIPAHKLKPGMFFYGRILDEGGIHPDDATGTITRVYRREGHATVLVDGTECKMKSTDLVAIDPIRQEEKVAKQKFQCLKFQREVVDHQWVATDIEETDIVIECHPEKLHTILKRISNVKSQTRVFAKEDGGLITYFEKTGNAPMFMVKKIL